MDLGRAQASGIPPILCALVFALAAGILATRATRSQLWVLWITSIAITSTVSVLEMHRVAIPDVSVVLLGANAAAIWVGSAIIITRWIARRSETARPLRKWHVDLFGWLGTFIIRFAREIHFAGGLVQPCYWPGGQYVATPVLESLAAAVAVSLFFVVLLFGPPLLMMGLGRVDLYHRDEPMPIRGSLAT